MVDAATNLRDFRDYHQPALEQNEARHTLVLAILSSIDQGAMPYGWTLGSPSQCAVMSAGWPIVLADLEQEQCQRLAEATIQVAYPGVVGPDLTARWFAERATELGHAFLDPIPQQIHALSEPPRYPGAPGSARSVAPDDAEVFADWLLAFNAEATPQDLMPSRERLAKVVTEGRHMFWTVDGEPVSVAGIVRRTRICGSIGAVYTPPALRGRGYAGSVTAAVVERLFAEGKTTACLYTDLRNPYSNRCYAKIGFRPICGSLHIPRGGGAVRRTNASKIARRRD